MHTRAQSIALVGCSVLFTILLGVFGQSSIAQAQADNIDATVDASVTASITPDQLRMLTYTVPALVEWSYSSTTVHTPRTRSRCSRRL
jgi:hypothetical protein